CSSFRCFRGCRGTTGSPTPHPGTATGCTSRAGCARTAGPACAWYGQRDLVVVAECALEVHRELVVVARNVPVEHVEPILPRTVVGDLFHVLVGDVEVGDVVDPEPVELPHLGQPGGLRVVRAVTVVVGRRGRQLGCDRTELHLEGDGGARVK